jgi:hypothetical protein
MVSYQQDIPRPYAPDVCTAKKPPDHANTNLTIIFNFKYASGVLSSTRRVPCWAWLRTAVVAAGLPFVAVSLGTACLDYAGEELVSCGKVVGSGSGSALAKLAGSGSGSGLNSGAWRPDCGTPTDASAERPSGSGSGSGATP